MALSFETVLPNPLLRRLRDDRRGVASLEFVLIAPVLFFILLGIVYVSILFNNYLELGYGVGAAGRAFAASRGSSTPYSSTTAIFYASAPALAKSNVTLTLSVAGTACSADTACQTALSNAAGDTASVSASYKCSLSFMNKNFIPDCTLTSSLTERVQ
ncbi:MAG: pilus assembly protein [Proteobacteria bacterium]|nr:pilus assembly protein [Pseudomonadota bacterium]